MANHSEGSNIKALKDAVDEQQDRAFSHQSDVIRYVHDVKDALSRLVDQVVVDQEKTSKLCAEARSVIVGHTDSVAACAETEDALRLHVNQLESERDGLREKVELFRGKLDEAKTQLRRMAEGTTPPSIDDPARIEVEKRLHEEQIAHEAARGRIAKLEAELKTSANLSNEIVETRRLLVEAESRAQSAEEAVRRLDGELNEARAESRELKFANENRENRERELAGERDSAHSVLEKLRSEVENLRESEVTYQVVVGRLEEELQREHATVGELQETLDSMTEQSKSVNEQSANFTRQIQELEETVRAKEDSISGLRVELKKVTDAKETAETKADELRNAARSATGNERHLEKQIAEMEEELELLRPMRPELRQMKDIASALEIQLENVRLEKQRLESEATSELSRGIKSRLAEQLAEALKEQELAQEAAKSLRREVEILQDEISALRGLADAPARVDVTFDDIAARQQLGDLLLSSGIISHEQLQDVVQDREVNGAQGRIGQLFVDKGYASEDAVAQALAHQMEVPFLRITQTTIQHEAVRLISERLAEQHHCVPVRIEDGKLVVAMENPMDLIAIENIERASELTVMPTLATATDIERAIRVNYRNARLSRT